MQASSENQAAYCYRELISRLQQRKIKPGDYLREQQVAEEFGMSRTPVREALRKLETEGLAVSESRLGMRIRTLDYTEVIELYEVRDIHERAVARLAADKATAIELSELDTIQQQFEKAKNDPPIMAAANLRFHHALLQMARNRFLTKAVLSMQRTLLILGPSTLEDTQRASTAIKEHRAIIKAIKAGDANKAESLMSEHLNNAQRSRIRQYQQSPLTEVQA